VTESAVQQTELAARPARRLVLSWVRELALLPAIAALCVAGAIVSDMPTPISIMRRITSGQ